MADLEGKVALVTGAARGQGRAHSIALAKAGAKVVAVDLCENIDRVYYDLATPADLEQTVKEIEAIGGTAMARKADTRSQEQLDEVVREALEEFGRLDIVVANAGIGTTLAKTWELTDDDWFNALDVNLTGVWRTIKATAPAIIDGGRGGAYILTSSLAGLKGYQHLAHYSSSKHGVNGLMKVLANELGPHNIRVNSICPGLVNTDMMMNQPTYDVWRPDLEKPTKDDTMELFETFQVLPISYLEPEDVSEAVVWLASDHARVITGVALTVDGGQYGRG
ncbi:mycofactocin-coupled SDR family oxidoreductase [Gordonia sp. GONU]|uniref:mycofactocin-coupled SDR family oxidoreductase n=1 Tax=Gordonia TaxID=2053 RepID=UPI0004005013|nr:MULTISPECIES: mycofactocin-coupled SDR family oxidoreductase [Gordonia]MCR8896048.1 mycofactocin-coupled SDR family oxidoreductase [Gordonia sp. GONU]MCZ4650594.1 mycofactocin-coupled SDR family oxidoreductase [Gordonia amicalis]